MPLPCPAHLTGCTEQISSLVSKTHLPLTSVLRTWVCPCWRLVLLPGVCSLLPLPEYLLAPTSLKALGWIVTICVCLCLSYWAMAPWRPEADLLPPYPRQCMTLHRG